MMNDKEIAKLVAATIVKMKEQYKESVEQQVKQQSSSSNNIKKAYNHEEEILNDISKIKDKKKRDALTELNNLFGSTLNHLKK